MSLENPQLLETADKFYTNTETSELTEPTEEPVTLSEQDPIQEVEELEPEEVKAESEELESKDEEEESRYIELDGEEIDLEDVKKWRDNGLMQSDYTKKTTALADERKTFDAERSTERENLLKERAEVNEMRDTLSVLVAEDEVIDWAELKEDDPERYIELKEKADKRKEALGKIKAERLTPADDPVVIKEESGKLFSANPDWLDKDGKTTEAYVKDITMMNDYATRAGFSTDEFATMTKARYLTTILKASKYDQLQDKGREIKAKREKVPIVTKPKAHKTEQPVNAADLFYGKPG